MKIKNYYFLVCAIWIGLTLFNSIFCLTNFVEGNLAVGFLLLILSISLSFVSGILFNKAIFVHQHNKACEFLEEVREYLQEKSINQIEPFEDFKNEQY